jgi:hypothetical protein
MFFHVQLHPKRGMYAQYAPLVRRFVAYSASTALTLRPVFQAIQALSERGAVMSGWRLTTSFRIVRSEILNLNIFYRRYHNASHLC